MKEFFNKHKWLIGLIAIFLILGNNKVLPDEGSGDVDAIMEELNELSKKQKEVLGKVGAHLEKLVDDQRDVLEKTRTMPKKIGPDVKELPSSADMQTIMKEFNKLREKVGALEKRVVQQEQLIGRQKQALEKVGDLVPEIKEVLLPPEPKILVKNFVLNGVNLFDPKDFEPVLNKYRNKKLGMRDFKKIADEITNFYRSEGYITSLVYAPTQEIDDSTVEFSVIEGRVGDIDFEEGKFYSKKAIARKFRVEKGQILDYKRLSESVKRINKQPDRTVKAVLLPGDEPETSNILLKLQEERNPRHFYIEYNNLGTKLTGKERYGIGFVDNDLFGFDDILSAKFKVGDNYDQVYSASVDYNLPVSSYDTRVGAYAAYSTADIGGQFGILTPEGKATAWGVYLTHPLFNKDFSDPVALNLASNVIFGIDFISVWNKILGRETSHDELRVLKAGISFDEKDSLGRTFMSHEFRVGIADFLGSMDEHDVSASRIDAGGEFYKYAGSLTRVTRLPFSSNLIGSIKYQVADRALVNSEQMSLGGASSIRGYPENDYLADYGWMSTMELRTPAFIFPRGLKVPFDKTGTPLKEAIQFAYFVDFGKGYLKKPRTGEVGSKFLIGTGLGLRFEFTERFRGRVDWGFPVGNEEPSDGSTSRVHLGFQYDLW